MSHSTVVAPLKTAVAHRLFALALDHYCVVRFGSVIYTRCLHTVSRDVNRT